MSNQIVCFEYEDGHVQKFSGIPRIRGLGEKGRRPIRAYVNGLTAREEYMVSLALEVATPEELMLGVKGQRVSKLYKPLDKYIEFNGELIQIKVDQMTQDWTVQKGDVIYKYEEHLDGVALDEESARDKYPEAFI